MRVEIRISGKRDCGKTSTLAILENILQERGFIFKPKTFIRENYTRNRPVPEFNTTEILIGFCEDANQMGWEGKDERA